MQRAVRRARQAASRARLAAAARARRNQLGDTLVTETASDRGIQEYARMRGLLITQRETARTWPDGPGRLARTVAASCRLAGQLTHGRLTYAHDEVLYVIRRPEERFARVV